MKIIALVKKEPYSIALPGPPFSRQSVKATAQKPLFPGINEAVLTQCIHAYREMGCWPPEMAISEEGYNTMLDIFALDQKITKRHAYDAICFRLV